MPCCARGLHGLDDDDRRWCRESAAKMPPVWNQRTPCLPKMWFQSKSPGFSCDGGRSAAVGAADGAAHAEAALGEVQAIARSAADAVERAPI